MRLACAPNFRDIGGVPGAEGRIIHKGRIFRSEAVLHPSGQDAQVLREAGIALVCDLRSAGECEHAPNAWWAAQQVPVLPMDVLAGVDGPAVWDALRMDNSEAGGRSAMKAVYAALPKAAAPHLAVIFSRLACTDMPLLIHCTAGKDRTGFVCAVILAALGAGRDAIVADYLASAGHATTTVVDHTRRMAVGQVGQVSDPAIAALIGVDSDYLDESFARIDAEFGSFAAYLRDGVGIDDRTMHRIRAVLLA